MNYIFCHKWKFALGMICLSGSFVNSFLNKHSLHEALLALEVTDNREVRSLRVVNLEKLGRWDECPVVDDLFTLEGLPAFNSPFVNDAPSTVMMEPIMQERMQFIQLDGWASIEGKMVFVFSSSELNISCIGSVGDFFEDLAFSVESFDYKIIENQLDGHSVPLVTILNREFNERVVLTPVSYMEFE